MSSRYFCPHCNNQINIDDKIVLIFTTKDNKSALVFLHAQLGNYNVKCSIDLNFKSQESVNFYCPICKENLESKNYENFATLNLVENNKTYEIIFSRIYGVKCTYKIQEKLISAFGADAKKYSDIINISRWK